MEMELLAECISLLIKEVNLKFPIMTLIHQKIAIFARKELCVPDTVKYIVDVSLSN